MDTSNVIYIATVKTLNYIFLNWYWKILCTLWVTNTFVLILFTIFLHLLHETTIDNTTLNVWKVWLIDRSCQRVWIIIVGTSMIIDNPLISSNNKCHSIISYDWWCVRCTMWYFSITASKYVNIAEHLTFN